MGASRMSQTGGHICGSRPLAAVLGEVDDVLARIPGRVAGPFLAVAELTGTAAQDIVAGYKSQTFKTAILSDRFYDGFALPDYLR